MSAFERTLESHHVSYRMAYVGRSLRDLRPAVRLPLPGASGTRAAARRLGTRRRLDAVV